MTLNYTVAQRPVVVEDLGEVQSNGDCMFLALSRSIQIQLRMDLSAKVLRKMAIRAFSRQYLNAPMEAQEKIDAQIQHFYCPDLSTGWTLQPIKTHFYILPVEVIDDAHEEVLQLMELGMDETLAKVHVYQDYAFPVNSVASYVEFMSLRARGKKLYRSKKKSKFRSIAMHYDAPDHCFAVDDRDQSTTWGDDLMLEALATVIQRPILVLMMCENGKFLQLEHRPYESASISSDEEGINPEIDEDAYQNLVPIVLKMKSDGFQSNGGDHYEPMRAFIKSD